MKTQKLVNHFPSWTIVRRDESSLGQRLLSTYSELLENESFSILKEIEEKNLYTNSLWNGDLYRIDLSSDEYMTTTRSFGQPTYTYPTQVGGEEEGVVYVIERQETIEDFMYSAPTRLALISTDVVSDWLVWNTSGISNNPEVTQRLLIKVTDATEFREDPYIYIRGKDHNYYPCAEIVRLKDQAEYKTKNAYSSINEIETSGLDATIEVYIGEKSKTYVQDRRRSLVSETAEGSFRVRLSNNGLEYYFPLFDQGSDYIGAIEGEIETEEQVCIQDLLDESEVEYTPVALTIGPHDGKLYVMDDAWVLHVHDLAFCNFVQPTESPSDDIYMEIIPIKRRVKKNDNILMWTFHRVLRLPVDQVRIKRYDPSGNIEYLQSDKTTWDAAEFWFDGVGSTSLLPEDSWTNIQFDSSFDEHGQWEFVCDVKFASSTETSRFITCVFCESNISIKDIDVGLADVEDIWFDHENYLIMATNLGFNKYDLRWDYYYADVNNQRLFLRHPYENTEVVI